MPCCRSTTYLSAVSNATSPETSQTEVSARARHSCRLMADLCLLYVLPQAHLAVLLQFWWQR